MNHLNGTTIDLYSIMLVLDTVNTLNNISVTFIVKRFVVVSKTSSIATNMVGITS